MHVKRIDHMSFTVGDLDRSAAFYRRFGFEDVKRYVSAGPHVDRGADTEDADMELLWLERPEGGPMLELIRYVKKSAGRSAHNSQVGAAHICFVLEDVFGAHAELAADGLTFLSEPNEDEFGVRWVYLRDPDGNAVELIQGAGGHESDGVNWGLIGASSIAAEQMIPAIRRAGGTIRAVHSRSEPHGQAFARAHDIPSATTSLDVLLDDAEIDAVYVSSINALHREQVQRAAGAGKHVLCDKPLATTEQDASAMVDACQAKGVVLAINHHLREEPVLRELRTRYLAGAIGELRAVRVAFATELPAPLRTWRVDDKHAGGGVVLDLTVHSADLVRFLTGEELEEVTALTGHAHGPAVESEVATAFRLTHGALGVLHESFTVPHAGNSAELHGSLGSLVASDALLPEPASKLRLRRGTQVQELVCDDHRGPYDGVVVAFGAAVRGEGPPSASGQDGLQSLRIGRAVLESAAGGRAVTLKPDGDPGRTAS